jgi:hypothetical protein
LLQKGYFEGIEANLKLMKIFYPDWILRLYVDLQDSGTFQQTF